MANLLFKNHQELHALIQRQRSGLAPMEFGFNCRGLNTSIVQEPDGSFSIKIQDLTQGLGYRVKVPADAGKGAPVLVTLEQPGQAPKELAFNSSEFLKTGVPGIFAQLHEVVVAELNRYLGTKWHAQPNASAASESPAAATSDTQAQADAATPVASNASDASPAVLAEPAEQYNVYLVPLDGKPDVRFKGVLRARAFTVRRAGRQHIYSVFQTPSGKWVALKQGVSFLLGERDLNEVEVYESLDDVVAFFGYSALAKALYQQLNLVEKAESYIE